MKVSVGYTFENQFFAFFLINDLVYLSLEIHWSQVDIAILNAIGLTNDLSLMCHDDIEHTVFKTFGRDVNWIKIKNLSFLVRASWEKVVIVKFFKRNFTDIFDSIRFRVVSNKEIVNLRANLNIFSVINIGKNLSHQNLIELTLNWRVQDFLYQNMS